MSKQSLGLKMRVIHRYLGFFLAGIMAMYSISGIILVFRNTDFLKKEYQIEKQVKSHASKEELGTLLKRRRLKVDREEAGIYYFEKGTYNTSTGEANYTITRLPFVLDKMTKLHKATTNSPLYFLNIFFGFSLLFFVISSFWMFMPKTAVFKKGLWFSLGGIILTLVMLLL